MREIIGLERIMVADQPDEQGRRASQILGLMIYRYEPDEVVKVRGHDGVKRTVILTPSSGLPEIVTKLVLVDQTDIDRFDAGTAAFEPLLITKGKGESVQDEIDAATARYNRAKATFISTAKFKHSVTGIVVNVDSG